MGGGEAISWTSIRATGKPARSPRDERAALESRAPESSAARGSAAITSDTSGGGWALARANVEIRRIDAAAANAQSSAKLFGDGPERVPHTPIWGTRPRERPMRPSLRPDDRGVRERGLAR